jgi:hypothetical protein
MTVANPCKLNHAEFLAIKSDLIADLADAFAKKLESMGEDVCGITWFSSCADDYAGARVARAA